MSQQAAVKKDSSKSASLSVVDEVAVPVGCDDGHFGIKLCLPDFSQLYIPSRIAAGAVISLDDADANCYEASGQTYTVSNALQSIDTRFPDYPLSDVNRVLVNHALIKAGLGGKSIKLVTGLPVQDYYIGGQRNDTFIERKRKSLTDGVVTNRNEAVMLPRIVAHQVISEGIAAFYDLLVGKDGNVNGVVHDQVSNGAIAVIDIGGKTTDSAVIINGGMGIDASRSGTANLGGLSLNVAVEQRLKQVLNVEGLAPRQIEDATTKYTVRAFGKEHDVADAVREEKRALAAQIIGECRRRMRDAADLEAVYFVGGGSMLLRDELKGLFPHAVFVEDPQFANARGMLKFAKYILG